MRRKTIVISTLLVVGVACLAAYAYFAIAPSFTQSPVCKSSPGQDFNITQGTVATISSDPNISLGVRSIVDDQVNLSLWLPRQNVSSTNASLSACETFVYSGYQVQVLSITQNWSLFRRAPGSGTGAVKVRVSKIIN